MSVVTPTGKLRHSSKGALAGARPQAGTSTEAVTWVQGDIQTAHLQGA